MCQFKHGLRWCLGMSAGTNFHLICIVLQVSSFAEHVSMVFVFCWQVLSGPFDCFDYRRLLKTYAFDFHDKPHNSTRRFKLTCCSLPCCSSQTSCLCRVLAGMGGTKHSAKFLLPMRAKHPSSLPLMLLAAHSLSQVTASCVGNLTAFHASFSKKASRFCTLLYPMLGQQGRKVAPSCQYPVFASLSYHHVSDVHAQWWLSTKNASREAPVKLNT